MITETPKSPISTPWSWSREKDDLCTHWSSQSTSERSGQYPQQTQSYQGEHPQKAHYPWVPWIRGYNKSHRIPFPVKDKQCPTRVSALAKAMNAQRITRGMVGIRITTTPSTATCRRRRPRKSTSIYKGPQIKRWATRRLRSQHDLQLRALNGSVNKILNGRIIDSSKCIYIQSHLCHRTRKSTLVIVRIINSEIRL